MSSTPVNKPTPQATVFDLLRRLHFYIGLFVAPFIFIAALTGTLYVLTPQIENMMYANALFVPAKGSAKPLSEQISAARKYIGEPVKIYAVRPAPGANDTTRVQFSAPDLGASESRSIFIDPYTLQVKGDMTVYGTSGVLPFRMWLDQLHRGLLLGDIGRYYSELAASWLWLAALGGILLWLATGRRHKIKKHRGRLAVTRHWHLTLGVILSLGLFFFSVTGLTWSQWAGTSIEKMRSDLGWLTPQVNTRLTGNSTGFPAANHDQHSRVIEGMDMSGMATARRRAVMTNRPDNDWDNVLNAARRAGIDATKVEIRQPKAIDQAWTVTEVDRSWPPNVDAVSVDPNNFTLVDHVRFANFPLVAKLTRWGIDAHMGVLFGLPNQLILAAFGLGLCVMIFLGYRMWWIRRPVANGPSCGKTLLAAWLTLSPLSKITSTSVLLALGYILPLMGISLLAFLFIDLVRANRHQILGLHRFSTEIQAGNFSMRRKKVKQFILAVVLVLVIALSILSSAMIGGAIDEYHIPLSDWSVEMLVTQIFMIAVYAMVFTGLLSIPLWYWFLGGENESESGH